MRNLLRLTLLAGVVASAMAIPVSGASAASFHNCSGGFNPDGSKGAFYSKIKAKNTSCKRARAVAHAWIVYEYKHSSLNPTSRVMIGSWSCKGKSVPLGPGDTDGGLLVTCTLGSKAVRFYGHP
jgi:hypothetical protein